jgi:hypothetical protein
MTRRPIVARTYHQNVDIESAREVGSQLALARQRYLDDGSEQSREDLMKASLTFMDVAVYALFDRVRGVHTSVSQALSAMTADLPTSDWQPEHGREDETVIWWLGFLKAITGVDPIKLSTTGLSGSTFDLMSGFIAACLTVGDMGISYVDGRCLAEEALSEGSDPWMAFAKEHADA